MPAGSGLAKLKMAKGMGLEKKVEDTLLKHYFGLMNYAICGSNNVPYSSAFSKNS